MSRRTLAIAAVLAAVCCAVTAAVLRDRDMNTSTLSSGVGPTGTVCASTAVFSTGDDSGVRFPLRDALPGSNGAVRVSGVVTDHVCTPQAGVLVRFWAAQPSGSYTPDSYGAVRTAADGTYQFETPFPGTYPGADPHVHVSVRIGGADVRTEVHPVEGTQQYVLDITPPAAQAPTTDITSAVVDGSGGSQLP